MPNAINTITLLVVFAALFTGLTADGRRRGRWAGVTDAALKAIDRWREAVDPALVIA